MNTTIAAGPCLRRSRRSATDTSGFRATARKIEISSSINTVCSEVTRSVTKMKSALITSTRSSVRFETVSSTRGGTDTRPV